MENSQRVPSHLPGPGDLPAPSPFDKSETALARRLLTLDCLLFRSLSERDLAGFLAAGGAQITTAGPGQVLREYGEPQSDFGVLISGQAEIRQYDDPGRVFTVDVLEPGELFGEITAFSPAASWPATVVAETVCEVLYLPVHFLTTLPGGRCHCGVVSRDAPGSCGIIAENLIRLIASKALNLRGRIEILTRNAMRSRIAVFLLQQSREAGRLRFSLPVNRDGMARYLNVSRPSMSRELGRMKEDGLIEFYRNSFTILDPVRLAGET